MHRRKHGSKREFHFELASPVAAKQQTDRRVLPRCEELDVELDIPSSIEITPVLESRLVGPDELSVKDLAQRAQPRRFR
jgi:hypothetical protein